MMIDSTSVKIEALHVRVWSILCLLLLLTVRC